MNLKNATTQQLAAELLSRNDLIDSNGLISHSEMYQLVAKIQPMPCVDGVAVRRNAAGEIEGMAIRRGTGKEKGKLCSVGGRIRINESIEDCLRRQFRTDLGCEIKMLVPWSKPTVALQCTSVGADGAWRKDFGPEYGKHTTSNYYPVRLIGEPKFGSTEHGGQEVLGVEWYSLGDLPPRDAFGYDQQPKFISCLRAAEGIV